MLKKLALLGALIIGFIGSSVWADESVKNELQEIRTVPMVTLNAETIREIPQIPIIFEGVTYQPDEYLAYFDAGLKIDLFLIRGLGEQGNDVFYAFTTAKEATSGLWLLPEPDVSLENNLRAACTDAECARQYDRDSAYCRKLRNAKARALCWAAAAVRYGACLAVCK